MADFEHTVVRPDVRDRLLPRLHGLGEINAVVLGDRATVNFFDGAFGKRVVLEFLDRRSLDLAAVDEEPTLGPLEENAVVPFAVIVISTPPGIIDDGWYPAFAVFATALRNLAIG